MSCRSMHKSQRQKVTVLHLMKLCSVSSMLGHSPSIHACDPPLGSGVLRDAVLVRFKSTANMACLASSFLVAEIEVMHALRLFIAGSG